MVSLMCIIITHLQGSPLVALCVPRGLQLQASTSIVFMNQVKNQIHLFIFISTIVSGLGGGGVATRGESDFASMQCY